MINIKSLVAGCRSAMFLPAAAFSAAVTSYHDVVKDARGGNVVPANGNCVKPSGPL